jgi:hypothetical protein
MKESLDPTGRTKPLPFDRLAAGGAHARQGEIEGRAKHGARRVRGALKARNGNDAGQFIHPVALIATLPHHGEVVTAADAVLVP